MFGSDMETNMVLFEMNVFISDYLHIFKVKLRTELTDNWELAD